MKVYVFESHPVQYHAPVYRELHKICEETRVGSVKVFYATDISLKGHADKGFGTEVSWDEPLLAGYDSVILHNENGTPLQGFWSLTGKHVWRILSTEKPDVVLLTQLAYRYDWMTFFVARLLGVQVWLRTETQDHAFTRSFLKNIFRTLVYKIIYLGVQRFLAIGKLNAEHYRKHGVREYKLFRSPYCVVDRFQSLSPGEKNRIREEIRTRLGFAPETVVMLFCGKFQEKKNPEILLDVLKKMQPDERKRFGVLFVGSGILEEKLRTQAAKFSDIVIAFSGFKNQTELPAYYLASDILILPSRQMGETWGLVVNEALLAQKRVIVSQHVGCGEEFKELPSVRIFDGSVDDLLVTLRVIPPEESTTGQIEWMSRYSVRAAAEGIVRAMHSS